MRERLCLSDAALMIEVAASMSLILRVCYCVSGIDF